jgi:hypothetical protein
MYYHSRLLQPKIEDRCGRSDEAPAHVSRLCWKHSTGIRVQADAAFSVLENGGKIGNIVTMPGDKAVYGGSTTRKRALCFQQGPQIMTRADSSCSLRYQTPDRQGHTRHSEANMDSRMYHAGRSSVYAAEVRPSTAMGRNMSHWGSPPFLGTSFTPPSSAGKNRNSSKM